MGKIGRPTKYKHEFIKIAEDYLQECKNMKKIPFLEEVAIKIGVSEKTVSRWSEANDDFCLAIEDITLYQKMALKTLGLGKNTTQMAIFLLKANHGLIETEKIQHESSGGEPLSIIFTDVATWKRAKENSNKLEHTNGVVKEQVISQNATEVLGSNDWTDYNKITVDENGQNLI